MQDQLKHLEETGLPRDRLVSHPLGNQVVDDIGAGAARLQTMYDAGVLTTTTQSVLDRQGYLTLWAPPDRTHQPGVDQPDPGDEPESVGFS